MRNFDGYAYDRMSPAWLKMLIKNNEDKWINASDEEVMRWLYIELGNRFSFSRKYRYAITGGEKAKIESAAKDVVMRPRRINTPDSLICIDIEETMKMLLSDLYGIDSRVLLDGSGPHVYLEVRTENYGRVKLDLQEDLCNVKAGRRSEHFASESSYDGRSFMTIPEDKVKEMDKKLGYIGEDEKYMEDYLEEYREKIAESKTPDEMIQKVFVLLEHKFSKQLKAMKYCERTELYKKVIKDMMPDIDVAHRTFRVNGKFVSCFILPEDHSAKRYYLYNKTKSGYEEIDDEKYQELYQINKEIIRQAMSKEPKIDE